MSKYAVCDDYLAIHVPKTKEKNKNKTNYNKQKKHIEKSLEGPFYSIKEIGLEHFIINKKGLVYNTKTHRTQRGYINNTKSHYVQLRNSKTNKISNRSIKMLLKRYVPIEE
jgi:hypothetical protein